MDTDVRAGGPALPQWTHSESSGSGTVWPEQGPEAWHRLSHESAVAENATERTRARAQGRGTCYNVNSSPVCRPPVGRHGHGVNLRPVTGESDIICDRVASRSSLSLQSLLNSP